MTLYQVLGCAPFVQSKQPRRHLGIHEYQAMDLLTKYGIQVPQYKVATTPDEAFEIAKNYGMHQPV